MFSKDGRFISSKFGVDTWRNRGATCVPKSADRQTDRQTAFRLYIVDILDPAVLYVAKIYMELIHPLLFTILTSLQPTVFVRAPTS